MRNGCVKHRVGGSVMCSGTTTTTLLHEPAFLQCQNMVQGPKRHAQWSHVPCQQDYWTLACKIGGDFVRPFPCQRYTLCGVIWEVTHLAMRGEGPTWRCPAELGNNHKWCFRNKDNFSAFQRWKSSSISFGAGSFSTIKQLPPASSW